MDASDPNARPPPMKFSVMLPMKSKHADEGSASGGDAGAARSGGGIAIPSADSVDAWEDEDDEPDFFHIHKKKRHAPPVVPPPPAVAERAHGPLAPSAPPARTTPAPTTAASTRPAVSRVSTPSAVPPPPPPPPPPRTSRRQGRGAASSSSAATNMRASFAAVFGGAGDATLANQSARMAASVPKEDVVPAQGSSSSSSSSSKVGVQYFPSAQRLGRTRKIIVAPVQRDNPLIKHIRNVPIEYGDIPCDYLLSSDVCALFLSLQYHKYHPKYVQARMNKLKRQFRVRVLLVLVDVKDPAPILAPLQQLAMFNAWSVVCAWSNREAAHYLQSFKAFETAPAELLMGRRDTDFESLAVSALTAVRAVNKTDVAQLLYQFGSVKNVMAADREELALIPGLGPKKVQQLYDVLRAPFMRAAAKGEDKGGDGEEAAGAGDGTANGKGKGKGKKRVRAADA